MVDLCHGPHLPNTGYLKTQAVNNLSRAFWRADVTKDPLQARPLCLAAVMLRATSAAGLLHVHQGLLRSGLLVSEPICQCQVLHHMAEDKHFQCGLVDPQS